MRRLAALLCLILGGCPASHRRGHGDGDSDTDSDVDADSDSDFDAGADANPGPFDAGFHEDVWIDPGCADAGAAPTDYRCDLFDPGACGYGMACYPTIDYPPGECAQELYGSACFEEGSGGQDDYCEGALDCRSGFACFQSGEGERCLQLCPLVGDSGCPPGLICAPTDVPDMGACA
jgi:hypothetical protein